jgi:hypothetical protein
MVMHQGRAVVLRVTFEVVPFGFEEDIRTIGAIELGLLDCDENGVGSYVSRIETDGRCPNPPINKEVYLTNPRELGAYELVRRAIKEHWRE